MYNQCVKFHNLDEIIAYEVEQMKRAFAGNSALQRFTVISGSRVFISRVLLNETDRVIQLDSDLIINLDISELWKIELGDAPLAAVTEVAMGNDSIKTYAICTDGWTKGEDYFNSGVMLINLKALHEEQDKIFENMNLVEKNPQYVLMDQDILNCTFSDRFLKLPLRFNDSVRGARSRGETKIDAHIYHYLAQVLNLNLQDNFNRLFFKYFAKTPWFNEETIEHLYDGIRQIYVEQKNFATQISAIVSGKTRAFFVAPESIDAIRQIFYVKPEEEIIAADSPESLQRVANSLAARNKIFFVLANYPAVHAALTHAGFVEGRDFLNAAIFLSDAHGVPLNTYSFVKLL